MCLQGDRCETKMQKMMCYCVMMSTFDKGLWFMWGKIKRGFIVRETFAMPVNEAIKSAHMSKRDVGSVMSQLFNLGALQLDQSGKSGKISGCVAI